MSSEVDAHRPLGETLFDADSPEHSDGQQLLERGDQVGRYVVTSVLGSGGMGVVYAAYDPELDRKVALKLLNPRKVKKGDDAAESLGHERLLREAQAMARLRHPNVIGVHDVGQHQGRVFVAMELVEGQTLRAWLQARKRSHREILPVFAAVAAGLSAAHAAGLVHRDVKPDNVMIDREGRVAVMDFGLARGARGKDVEERARDDIARESTTVDSMLTSAGALIGTPSYMAPEQFLRLETDARTDQFSYCVCLYEALYGERPFEGKSRDALASAVTEGRVRPAPRGTKVPARVRRVILRGLEPDPAARWPSMAELLGELHHDPMPDRLRWIVGLGMLMLVSGLAAALLLRPDEGDPCGEGDETITAVWSSEQRDALTRSFAGTALPYASDASEHVVAALDAWAQTWTSSWREACEATRVHHEQSSELMKRRTTCLEDRLARFEALTEVLVHADERVVEHAVQAASRLPALEPCSDRGQLIAEPTLALGQEGREVDRDLQRARAHFEAGRFAEGEVLAQAAIRRVSSPENADERDSMSALSGDAYLVMAEFEEMGGRWENAEHAAERAYFDARAARRGRTAATAAIALVRIVGRHRARPVEGLRWGRHAAAELDLLEGADALRADLLRNLGEVHAEQGRHEEAIEHFERALALQTEVLGPDHLDLAATLNAIGNARYARGRHEDALELHERVLDIRTRALGAGHPLVGSTHNNLGLVHEAMGRLDEAAAAHERALAIKQAAFGPEHPGVAVSHNNLGNLELARERPAEAVPHYEQALALMRDNLGPDHPQLAYPLTGLGRARLAIGQPEAALEPLERAVTLRESDVEPTHRAMSQFALARCLRALDREPERVLELARAARDVYARLGPANELAAVDAFLGTR